MNDPNLRDWRVTLLGVGLGIAAGSLLAAGLVAPALGLGIAAAVAIDIGRGFRP